MQTKITPIESVGNLDIDLRQWCSAVENQSNVGSCAPNAVVGAVEMRRIHAGFEHVDLSRLFAYFNARVGSRTTDKDDGSYIKLVLESMTRLGVCKESIWPYDTTKVFARPTWAAYRDAYIYKISQFYRITATGETRHNQIIAALRAHYPVVFGVQVWDSIFKCDGVIQMPTSSDKKLGGHAMLIVGVDIANRMYLIRNSWGTDWGDSGYARMPFAYFDVGGAESFWSMTL
jgi:C1A family cysteine protease